MILRPSISPLGQLCFGLMLVELGLQSAFAGGAEGLLVHAGVGVGVLVVNGLVIAPPHGLRSSNWPHFHSLR